MIYEFMSVAHIAVAIAAIVTGALIVGTTKGTYRHKAAGYTYVAAMVALNISALSIFKLTGRFGPFHYAALISLATVLAGFIPVFLRRPSDRWLHLHFQFMGWSYIGLIAGAISEVAVRLPATPFWPAVAAGSLLTFVVGWYALARNHDRLVFNHSPAGAQQAVPADVPRPAGAGRG